MKPTDRAGEEPLLSVRGLTRSFPGVKALSGVDLRVRRGEVHALMGENGAGKSTLIKVVTGVYAPDEGVIELDGRPISPRSPLEAQKLGISTVYQEVNLIPQLSIAENITLGRQPSRLGVLSWKQISERAERALARLDLDVDVSRPLNACSIALQQMTAIARALDLEAKLLILDEPTSSLDAAEVEQLFRIMRKLAREGLGIIFVTHFLDQVYAVSDRITVLRNGSRVGEFETASLPRLELISKMIGKEVRELEALSHHSAPERIQSGRTVFVEAAGLGKSRSIAPFDLKVAPGEVVGLAGLLGSGRTELARLFFGIDQPDSGKLLLDGQTIELRSPRAAVLSRFGYCGEDRKTDGIVPNLSVRENIAVALQVQRGPWAPLSQQEQDALAEKYIKLLNIMPADPERPIKFLSGGNQQKALLARWLAAQPRFLILDEPTRGIDVGAKFEIQKLIGALTTEGLAVLFISSEMEEVVRNSVRVLVLRDRRVIGELAGSEITQPAILQAIAARHEPESARN